MQRARYVTRSAGGSFSSQQTPSTPGVDSTGIDVAMNKSGAAVLVWMERGDSEEWIVRAMTKPAGGSFGAPQDVSASGRDAVNPSVALSDNGAAVVAWSRYNGTHIIAQAALKSSAGSSFGGALDVSSTTLDAGNVDSAIDPEGNSTVVWEMVDGAIRRIQARTKPSSGGFGAVQTLTPTGDGWAFVPRVAMSGNRRATAVWYRYPDGSFNGNAVVQSAETNTSGTFGAVQTLTPTTVNSFAPAVAVTKDNLAVASWVSQNGGEYIVYGAARNSGAFFGTLEPLSSPGSSSRSPVVSVDDNGNAMAIWGAAATSADAPVQASRRPAGGSFGGPQDVSPPGEKALAGSIDFDADGNGIVGYVRYTDSPTCCPRTMRGLGFDASGPVLSNMSVPGSATAGDSVGFSVSARDTWSSISQVRWNFGDGESATGGSVAHVYGAAGSYTVTVTATDAVGNSRSSSRTIAVAAPPTGGGGGVTPPPAITALSSTVTNSWLVYVKYTKATALAGQQPAGRHAVRVQCKTKKKKQQKKGCPYKTQDVHDAAARASSTCSSRSRRRSCRSGTRITITITAPGFIGKRFTYTMRKRKRPKRVAPVHPARRQARAAASELRAPLPLLAERALEQRREHDLGLRAGDARAVAQALERLLEVRGVARAHVHDRARLARDGVGGLDLGVVLDGVAHLGRRHAALAVELDERVRRPSRSGRGRPGPSSRGSRRRPRAGRRAA